MGEPGTSDRVTVQRTERTRGTETSHYPEEKKTKVIAQVVASERAGAQTGNVEALTGVVGPPINFRRTDSRSVWKVTPQGVKVP